MQDFNSESEEFEINETEDYDSLVKFFIENRLEYTEEDLETVPTDLVKCWRASGRDGKLLGGFVLAIREGEYICDGIATDACVRGKGLGKALLEKGLEEVRRLGGCRIFLVARAPEFFRGQGFVTVPKEEAPNFFECLTCPQFGVDCHPEVMKFDF